MSNTYKPTGYNSVSPYLVVKGAQQLADLLQQVFDAKVLRRYAMPDGMIMHMEVRIDDSVIMMADSSEKYPPNQVLLHVFVPDVDVTYNKALELGFASVETPKQRTGEPNRRGAFKDFNGNIWSVATQVEENS